MRNLEVASGGGESACARREPQGLSRPRPSAFSRRLESPCSLIDAQRPTAPARDTCALGCQHLLDCGLCILDAAGACLSVADCTGVCANTPTGPGVAGCVSGAGCEQTAISS